MSLEIDDINYVKYLVEYAVNKNNEAVCKTMDLQVSCWLYDINDVEFAEEVLDIIKNSSNKEWWTNTLNPEHLVDHTRCATHNDLETMFNEMFVYLKGNPKAGIVCADDPSINAIGYMVCEIKNGKEIARNFTITCSDAKRTNNQRYFKIDTPKNRMDILKVLSKFYCCELKNKYGF